MLVGQRRQGRRDVADEWRHQDGADPVLDAAPCAAELAALRAPLGLFAVPGNHDHWAGIDAVAAPLRAAGVTLLRNESRRLEVNGAPLWLAGLDDVMEGQADPSATDYCYLKHPLLL